MWQSDVDYLCDLFGGFFIIGGGISGSMLCG